MRCAVLTPSTGRFILRRLLLMVPVVVVTTLIAFSLILLLPGDPALMMLGDQNLTIAPWLSLAPGVAIFVAVLGLNLLGDGIRQILDPRLHSRGRA